MTFLNPTLATIGLACVGVPILIHILMRRRRKPIRWAAMRFLLEAYQQQRKRLRFEQILLLAARCLLIALIAIAIGRPILGGSLGHATSGPTTLYLLIDNGLASSAQDQSGTTALARQKEHASSLLSRLDASGGDRVAIIAASNPARALVLPATSDFSSARDLINSITSSDAASDLTGALALARTDATSDTVAAHHAFAMLSEFRIGSLDLSADSSTSAASEIDSTKVSVIAPPPAEAVLTNVGVTSVDPLRPVVVSAQRGASSTLAQAPVRIALRRSGDLSQAQTTSIRLLLSSATSERQTPVGSATFRWTPGQSQGVAMSTIDPAQSSSGTGDIGSGSLVLTAQIDADSIAGDNTFRRTIELRRNLRVGVVATRENAKTGAALDQLSPGDWYRLALQTSDAEIETVDIEPAALDAARLAGLDAAILSRPDLLSDDAWRRLRQFADAGGLIIVSPPPNVTVNTWPDAMAKSLGLSWSIPRESRAVTTTIAATRTTGSENDLLALIDADLGELVRSVRVSRVLAPDAASASTGNVLLSLADATPLLIASRPGQSSNTTNEPSSTTATSQTTTSDRDTSSAAGLVVMLALAPSFEWTDLQAKPLMVPLIQELVRQGVGKARGQWIETAGRVPRVPARSTLLRPAQANAEAIRIDATGHAEPIATAGVYRALDERGAVQGLVTVNADASAGRVDPQPRTSIESWLASRAGLGGQSVTWLESTTPVAKRDEAANAKTGLGKSPENTRLVLTVLITALTLGLIEALLSNWFSHAGAHTARKGATS